MSQRDNYNRRLAKHLNAARHPDNLGELLVGKDYTLLGIVTVVVPAVLLVIGWQF